jgi:hypothetical protein
MRDKEIRRWTGTFGIASGVLFVVATVIFGAIGTTPRAEDTTGISDYVTRNSGALLTFALAATLSAACFLVFLAGLRHLIRQARSDYEVVSGLVFGAGLVWPTLALVGFVLLGGAALDTINHQANPILVSALVVASTLTAGAIGLITQALFLAAAGYAILGTGVLPRWTGWVAYLAAILDLIAVPAVYAGSGPSAFYTADGYVTYLGPLAYLAWLLSASISMVVKREAAAPTGGPSRVTTAER